MNRRCYDSNLIIYSADPEYPALRHLLAEEPGYISAVTIVETLGYPDLTPDQRRHNENAIRLQRVLPVTDAVIARAVALRRERRMKLGDSLIAATVLEAGIPLLFTRNVKDFVHLPGVTVINPIDFPDTRGVTP
jgi:toxin FitB